MSRRAHVREGEGMGSTREEGGRKGREVSIIYFIPGAASTTHFPSDLVHFKC